MMSRSPIPPDDSWESDAVWQLLDRSTPVVPDAQFVNDAVRMVRMECRDKPAWNRWFLPASLAGMIAAATALILFGAVFTKVTSPLQQGEALSYEPSQTESYALLQDAAETETLMVAADHLDEFSDTELVSLLGF